MAQDFATNERRFQKLNSEIEFRKRRIAEKSKAAYDLVHSLNAEDVDKLSGLFPKLRLVAAFTEDDFNNDFEGRIKDVNELFANMNAYLENWLDKCEEEL